MFDNTNSFKWEFKMFSKKIKKVDVIDRRSGKDRRRRNGSRRTDIRWEPEAKPRRALIDRRQNSTTWKGY